MQLSIIIISYSTNEILRKCLHYVYRSTLKIQKEIIVVDNASHDGTVDMLKRDFNKVILVANKKNIGFARANIQGLDLAKGSYILLLNPDVFIGDNSIEKTISFMKKNPLCGIVGVRVVDKSGKLQPSARYFPTPWRLFLSYSGIGGKFPNCPFLRGVDNMKQDHTVVRSVDWVPGLFFLMRKKMVDKIGFFDARYYIYYEEIDLCLKAKKNGWKVFFYPKVSVIHLGGESAKKFGELASSGKQIQKFKLQSEFIYFRKNHGLSHVLLDFFFILLLNIIEIFKKMIIQKKHIRIREKIEHIKKAYSILLATKFGTKAIN